MSGATPRREALQTPGSTLYSMPVAGATLESVRNADLIDGSSVRTYRLQSPVGVDSVLEERGRHWHVVGVVSNDTELRALCVPHRP